MSFTSSTSRISSHEYFTRQASGLVRQISSWQAFIYNAYSVNPLLTLAFMLLTTTAALPGARLEWSTVLTVLLVIPLTIVYAWFAVLMPRSGGDYVYIARTLNPALGFAANWNMTIWFGFYLGAPCVLFAQWGVAPFLRGLGVIYAEPRLIQAAAWANTPMGGFLCATSILSVLVLLYIFSLRKYLTFQLISFVLGIVSVTCMLVVLGLSSRATFIMAFNSYIAKLSGHLQAYSLVEQAAKVAGYQGSGFDWRQTILALALPYLGLGFGLASGYFGGEVRQVSRSQWFAIPGSVLFSGSVMVFLLLGLNKTIGYSFLGQLSTVPGVIGMPAAPVFSELVAIMTSNVFMVTLILLGFAAWTYVWAPVNIMIITRNLLAWSTDRVFPDWLADVGDRWHSPYKAILVAWGLGEVFAYMYSYHPQFSLLTGVFGMTFTFIVTSFAATLLPYRHPELISGAPLSRRIRSVPLISIIGVASLLCLGAIEVLLGFAPGSGISWFRSQGFSFWMLWANVAVFVSGFVVYYTARMVRRRQGIDINLAYKTLPPE